VKWFKKSVKVEICPIRHCLVDSNCAFDTIVRKSLDKEAESFDLKENYRVHKFV
jgi:hypothetical protein